MKKKAPTAAPKQHYTKEQRQAAVAAVFGGSLPLAITINPRAEELTGHNLAGFTLLTERMNEMTNWEIGFCGSMVAHKWKAISPKQAERLNEILKKYLDLELERFPEKATQ